MTKLHDAARLVPTIQVDAFGIRCKAAMQRIAEVGLAAWAAEERERFVAETPGDLEWVQFVSNLTDPPKETSDARDLAARRRAGDYDPD